MSENYNLGARFGLNVSPQGGRQNFNAPKINIEELNKAVEKVLDNATSYVDKYENVFDGTVEKQINIFSRQAMIVGMNLKAAEPRRNFDVNI